MTALPEPGGSSADDHAQTAHRFLEHARTELQRGDSLQASEKVWGAAAHALKSVAVQRGWRHRSHSTVFDVGEHLGREFSRQERFGVYLDRADAMHSNFYHSNRNEGAIRLALADVEQFVDELDEIRASSPRSFTVRDNDDRVRLGHLLGLRGGDRPPIGSHSPVGFSQTHPEDTAGL